MIDLDIIPEDEFIKKYGRCRDNTISYETYLVNMRYYFGKINPFKWISTI